MADPVVTKHQLLEHLAEVEDASAREVAAALGVPYAAAAMALLRLGRQGLVLRYLDPDRGTYWYTLSAHGQARLAYFRGLR